jgi:hypothetical protein
MANVIQLTQANGNPCPVNTGDNSESRQAPRGPPSAPSSWGVGIPAAMPLFDCGSARSVPHSGATGGQRRGDGVEGIAEDLAHAPRACPSLARPTEQPSSRLRSARRQGHAVRAGSHPRPSRCLDRQAHPYSRWPRWQCTSCGRQWHTKSVPNACGVLRRQATASGSIRPRRSA